MPIRTAERALRRSNGRSRSPLAHRVNEVTIRADEALAALRRGGRCADWFSRPWPRPITPSVERITRAVRRARRRGGSPHAMGTSASDATRDDDGPFTHAAIFDLSLALTTASITPQALCAAGLVASEDAAALRLRRVMSATSTPRPARGVLRRRRGWTCAERSQEKDTYTWHPSM